MYLQQMLLVKLDSCMKKNANRSTLSPCIKLNSKWIKDFNIRPDRLNMIEESVGNSLKLIGEEKDSLKETLTPQAIRTTIK